MSAKSMLPMLNTPNVFSSLQTQAAAGGVSLQREEV